MCEVVHVFGEHRTDRMDALMSIETLSHEACQRALSRHFISQRDWVFDDDMHDRMQLHVWVWEANACALVILLREEDTRGGRPNSDRSISGKSA